MMCYVSKCQKNWCMIKEPPRETDEWLVKNSAKCTCCIWIAHWKVSIPWNHKTNGSHGWMVWVDGEVEIIHFMSNGGNHTMVAAATIVIMVAADGERISIFPLVCPNKARGVSFSVPDIQSVKGRNLVITVDVAVDPSFLVIQCRAYSPSRWLHQIMTMVANDVPRGIMRVAQHFWRTCPADNSRNMV